MSEDKESSIYDVHEKSVFSIRKSQQVLQKARIKILACAIYT